MKSRALTYLLLLLMLASCGMGGKNASSADAVVDAWVLSAPSGMSVDTMDIDDMDIKNPFILYNNESDMYCMVADGGYMWLSKNLRMWEGPYSVLMQDSASWIGESPVVTSPEIHKHGGKYYYMATFERTDTMVMGTDGKLFARCSCVALVADDVTGPYRTIDVNSNLLDVSEKAQHPTYCTDEYGVGYMIYNHDACQNGDGTVQIVRFTDDFGRRMGEAYVMFTASQNTWSRTSGGKDTFSPVIESPYLFITDEGGIGILFTTYMGAEKALGVAYSETGHLNGPWVIEPEPLVTGNVGGAMMFTDYDGTLVMVAQKDTIMDGAQKSMTRFYKMDSQFEKLQIKGYYKF